MGWVCTVPGDCTLHAGTNVPQVTFPKERSCVAVEKLSVRLESPVLGVKWGEINFVGTHGPSLGFLGDWLGVGKDAFPGIDLDRFRVRLNASHHG